ncbi:MAG: serine/threonine-protein kinase [Nostoc sp.]
MTFLTSQTSSNSKGYALVQSFVEGQSLEEYIKTGRIFTETEVKEIATALLNILIYLHGRQPPVIHRDIKPSNIILAERSNSVRQIYLVDFGSVQTLATKAGKTVTVVGTYGYMPPEQFGGYATPASDLYSLGATLIALATGIHPADLPQKDLRIAFQDLVKLSPALVGWLQWLTEPSLEQRLISASITLKTLETGQLPINDLAGVNPPKPVDIRDLLWNAIWRSTFTGGLVVAGCAAIYSTVVIPVGGSMIGLLYGALIGFPIAFVNGFLVSIITRLFFFPLKNAYLHRRTISIISTTFGMAAALFGFRLLFHGSFLDGSIVTSLFFMIAPSVITGLSMGAASKSIAQWYEKQYRLLNK